MAEEYKTKGKNLLDKVDMIEVRYEDTGEVKKLPFGKVVSEDPKWKNTLCIAGGEFKRGTRGLGSWYETEAGKIVFIREVDIDGYKRNHPQVS